ncbi:hypothetical protein CLCY_10c00100 [Clostridium cylindrosporum DSM 605]|uniref:Uncharacterized protein n=1 Tax=Clostridium cylindrosporum DSM 605 TaxID=1121307 RepID=A0A0J8D8T7_CLOCY|nr:hypothetical protein CLCY_10c00100 [Clostridium cylindrosporum DSM 605]
MLKHGFTLEVFKDDFVVDFALGVGIAIIVGIVCNFKEIRS